MTVTEVLLLLRGDGAGAVKAITEVETKLNGMAVKAEETNGKVAGFLGQAMKVVGVAVVAATVMGAVAAVKMAGDFQSATQRLVSSAGESQADLEKVRQGVLGLMGQVGESADEMTKAYYTASSAGFNYANGGLKVVQAAAEGAKAENADLKVVTDAVTTALVDYHLKADDAALVTSKLIAGVGQGKTTFAELTGALHSVLPLASAMHVSLDDIVGSLASMTVHGMSADQATQNMSHTLQHLQTVTAPQAKELAALGISARDLSDSLSQKGLSGTLQTVDAAIKAHMGADQTHVILNLLDAVKKLPPGVQSLAQQAVEGTISMGDYTKAAKALPPVLAGQASGFATLLKASTGIGKDQQNGQQIMQSYAQAMKAATGDSTTLSTALMLTGENTDRVKKSVDAVGKAHTEAGNHVQGWAGIQSTFNQKLSQAHGAFDAILIKVGTGFLPILGKLADWFTQHQQQIGDFVSKVLTVLGDTLSTIGAILGVTVIPLLGQLADHMTAVGVVVGGLLLVYAAFKLYALAMWTEEKVTFIAAQTAKGAAWASFYVEMWAEQAGFMVKNAAAWVAEKAKYLAGLAAKAASNVAYYASLTLVSTVWFAWIAGKWLADKAMFIAAQAAKLVVWLATNAVFVATAIATGVAAAAAFLLPLAPFILIGLAVAGLVYLVVTHFQQIKDFIGRIVGDIVGFVKEHWQLLLAIFLGPFGLFIGWVISHFGQIKDTVGNVLGDVVGFFKGLPGKVLAALGDLGNLLKDAGSKIIGGLLDGIKQKFEDVKNFVGGIGSWIGDHKGPLDYDARLLIPHGKAIMGGLHEGLSTGFGDVQSLVGGMGGRLNPGGALGGGVFSAAGGAGGGGGVINVYNPTRNVDVTQAIADHEHLERAARHYTPAPAWPAGLGSPA